MTHNRLLLFYAISTICFSCDKSKVDEKAPCGQNATVRTITNKSAIVKASTGSFVIIEMGTIDTRLAPCNLPAEFSINDLQVTISGDVKQTTQPNDSPCCTDDFVITSITK